MKIFEFHFHPKLKPDLLLESFAFEPQNIYEKKLGYLYVIGSLKNALPRDKDFLENLANFIREKYYQKNFNNPELALKEALFETNDFLSQLLKQGNVSWLGNLAIVVLSLKNFNLSFTKVGEMKIYLFRDRKIIDVDKKLKKKSFESYPLKFFGNIVSGKMIEGDLILVLNKELFEFFQNKNLIEKIATIFPFDAKEFKKLIDKEKEGLSQIKGMAFFVQFSKGEEKGEKEVILTRPFREFSLGDFLNSFFPFLNSKEKKLENFSFSQVFSYYKDWLRLFVKNKGLLFLLAFFLWLFFGFLWFK